MNGNFSSVSNRPTTFFKEDVFRLILDSLAEAVVIADANGVVQMVNPSVESMFGYKPDELLGQSIEVLIPDRFHKSHVKYRSNYYSKPVKRPMGKGIDLFGKSKDGSDIPVEISLNHMKVDDQLFVMALITNVTERKQAEKQLIDLNAQLESKVRERTEELANAILELQEANNNLEEQVLITNEAQKETKVALEKEKELGELKSRFVSMASHEFKTPLSSILSSATLLEKYSGGDSLDKQLKHIDRIKGAVKGLTDILNDLLSLEKLEAGFVQVHKTTIDIVDFGNNLTEEMQLIAKEGQQIEYQHKGAKEVSTDANLLRNILLNLISNAIKYSSEADKILFRTSVEKKTLSIIIQDQGCGIPKEDQKHLFSRFFRASNATNIQGTGLGLNIVKRYVELLDGEISFESKLDKGTTFTIQISLD